MATLRQFLQTGELGPLHLGMSEADVIALLGPPPDQSVARHPRILKYGGLQLTFLRRPEAADLELAHIGLYFAPCAEPIPEPALPADFKGTSETTSSQVREFLDRAGLKEAAVVETDEGTNYLILTSGARITFDGQILHSIILAARAASPAKKQVSVSISKDTWDQLRTLARQSNRSVAELCAEWITHRAGPLQHDESGGVRNLR